MCSLLKTGLPTNFPHDFQDKQTANSRAKFHKKNSRNGVWLVILFLSRKNIHAKQFCLAALSAIAPWILFQFYPKRQGMLTRIWVCWMY